MRASDSDRVWRFAERGPAPLVSGPPRRTHPAFLSDASTLDGTPNEKRQLIVVAESASRFHSSIASQIKNT